MHRLSWDEYFIGISFIISSRSRDSQTKHGAVIVDNNNIIIGTGYNSFIKNIDDSLFPTTRPEKYQFMLHSEENALLNCKVSPREVIGGATIYITGQPCNKCFQLCIQSGITRFYMANRKGWNNENDKEKDIFNLIVSQTKVDINYIDINLDWITETIENVKSTLQLPFA